MAIMAGHIGTGHIGTGHEFSGHIGTGHIGTGHEFSGHEGTGYDGTAHILPYPLHGVELNALSVKTNMLASNPLNDPGLLISHKTVIIPDTSATGTSGHHPNANIDLHTGANGSLNGNISVGDNWISPGGHVTISGNAGVGVSNGHVVDPHISVNAGINY